jgi:hypothetical protein
VSSTHSVYLPVVDPKMRWKAQFVHVQGLIRQETQYSQLGATQYFQLSVMCPVGGLGRVIDGGSQRKMMMMMTRHISYIPTNLLL